MKFLIIFSFLIIITDSTLIECNFKGNSTAEIICNLTIVSEHKRVVQLKKESASTYENVTSIIIQNSTVQWFPQSLENISKNVEAIEISSSDIFEIKSDDLKPFGERLKKLILNDNKIKELKRDLFVHNPNMEEINLNSNKISNVEPKTFSNLKKLKVLDFGNNSCVEEISLNKTNVFDVKMQIFVKCTETTIGGGVLNFFAILSLALIAGVGACFAYYLAFYGIDLAVKKLL